jgi:hypothetical protein
LAWVKVAPVCTFWYSSPTVGKRTAGPSEAVVLHWLLACQVSDSFGDSPLSPTCGWPTANVLPSAAVAKFDPS